MTRRAAHGVLTVAVAAGLLCGPGTARAHAEPPERVRTAPVTVPGAPRSLVTLVVPVPDELAGAGRLRYVVEPTGTVDVIGRLNGDVTRGAGDRPRSVLLTLRIPSDALVGLLDVADVVFVADDGRVYAVPIVVRVPAVRVIRVEGTSELAGLDRGDRLELAFRVRNLGNAVEPLILEAVPPRTWRGSLNRSALTVPAFGEEELLASLRVPLTASGGDHVLRIRALRIGEAGDTTIVAETRAVLRVRQPEPRLPGLVLRPTIGAVASRGGGLLAGGMQLDGPLVDDVRIRVQYSPSRQAQGNSGLGLAALGGLFVPFGASVESPTWRVDVGTLQASLGDLSGIGFTMDGARASVSRGQVDYVAFAARPAAQLRADGHLAGVGAWRQTPHGRVGGSVSSLREARGGLSQFSRELTAVAADFVANPLGAHNLSGGLAVRSSDGTTGVGMRARWDWRRDRDEVRASILHAPGGSRGFAIATTQLDVGGRRAITDRLSVDGHFLTARDDGSALRKLSRWSAGAGTAYALAPRTTLAARYAESDATVAVSRVGAQSFGARHRMLVNTVETRRGDWSLGTDLGVGQMIRRATLFSGGESVRGATQRSLEVRTGRRIQDLGTLSFGAQFQQSGAGVGLARYTRATFARWSDVPLLLGNTVFRATTEARVIDSEFQRGLVRLSGRIGARLRNGTEIAAIAERNPFLRDARGRELVVFGLRVSASTEVLAAGRLSAPGVVFNDRNGNGRRDPGEEGLADISLTHGNLRFTTNRHGEYRIPADVRGELRVDARSLPAGYVMHPRVATEARERREIPLVPTGSVTLRFVPLPDSSGRVTTVDLAALDVWLRNADGTEWVARSAGGGRFELEAIPVGTYELRTGTGRLRELVRVDERTIEVRGPGRQALEIPVMPRALRIINPPRGNGSREGVSPRGVAPRGVAPRGAAPVQP